MKRWMAVVAVLVAGASSVRAVDVVFSTDNAVPQPAGQNPVIYANVGTPVNLWLLVRRSGDEGFVQNLSLSIRAESDDGGAIIGPGLDLDNPYQYIGGDPGRATSYLYRWDTHLGGTESNGLIVHDAAGLSNSYRPGLSIEGDWSAFGLLDLHVAHEGTVRLYLQVGSYGILEGGGSDAVTSRFGWGDDPVANVAGAESTLWDATIVSPIPPIPEPAVIGLVGTAGLVVLERRRS